MALLNVTQAKRGHALDREEFQRMLEGEPFRLVMARIAGELKRAQETCARSDEVRDLRRAQGAAAALQSVLALPAAILAEMQKK
jgi:hypothetical protein